MDSTKVLESHYFWCLKEGRDVSWYKPQAPSFEPQATSNEELEGLKKYVKEKKKPI